MTIGPKLRERWAHKTQWPENPFAKRLVEEKPPTKEPEAPPLAEIPHKFGEVPPIPSEGVTFPFEVEGVERVLTLKPDYSIWEGSRRAGEYDPLTNMVSYEKPPPPEGYKVTQEGVDYYIKEDNSVWVEGKHIGTIDPEVGFQKITDKEAKASYDARLKEVYEEYKDVADWTIKGWQARREENPERVKAWNEARHAAWEDYQEGLAFAKPFAESLAGKAFGTLIKGMQQTFTAIGAAITAPFRPQEEIGGLTYIPAYLPGGTQYEAYKEWKGTPEEPHIYLPIPSWKQWGAWLKPVLKNVPFLKSLGVDVETWEEPTEGEIADIGFATARWGMGETAEWLPIIFAGTIAKALRGPNTALQKLSKDTIRIQLGRELASKEPIFKTTSGGRLTLIPTYEEMMWDVTKKFAGSPPKLVEKPLIRNLISVLNPKLVARNPVKQFKIFQGMMKDVADGAVETALRKLRILKPPKLKGRLVVDKRIKPKANAPKVGGKSSMEIGDVLSYSERYEMPANLRAWFNEMRAISKETTEMLVAELKKHDIVLKQLKRESDWVYFHRVVEKIGSIENLRLRNYRSMMKPRSLELAGEALPKKVKYLENPLVELQYQIEGAYNWIMDLRVKDAMKKITTTAKERVKPAIVDDLVEKNSIRIAAEHMKKLISRAKRGEVLPTVSLNAVDRKFPQIGFKLRDLVAKPASKSKTTALNKLSKQATGILGVAKEEYWAAKTIYQKALKQAGPTLEEGTTRYFGGRIFTTQDLVKPYGHFRFDPAGFRFVYEKTGKKILGRDLAREVEKQFGYSVPGLFERLTGKLGTLGGVLRETKASVDFSVQFIQTQLGGLGLDTWNLLTGRPSANWIKGAARGVQAGVMPRSYAKWAGRPEIIRASQEMISHRALIQASEYTEALGVLAPLLRKTIVGKPAAFIYTRANAAFTAGRTATATYMWMGERQLATKGLVGTALKQRLDELGMWINKSTGVLSTRGMGISPTQRGLEATFMFAPRYTRAVVASVMDIVRGGYTGAQAREALLGLLAAGHSFFTFVPMAMGQEPRLNPLPEGMGGDGAKWMTIKVGDSYVGVGGTIYGLGRLLANNWSKLTENPEDLFRLDMNNPNVRFLRGKFGPPVALGVDYVTGQGYLGNLTRENWTQVMGTALDWLMPIWVESVVGDEWYEHLAEKEPLDTHFEAALPEIFGMRTFPVSEYDKYMTLRDTYSRRDYGVAYRDIEDNADRDALFRYHPDLAELRDTIALDFEKRGSTFERWYAETTRTLNTERNAKLELIATAYINDEISKRDYDNQRSFIRPYYSGYKAALWEAREKFDEDTIKAIEKYSEKQSENDKALDEYQEIRNTPTVDPRTGIPNWRAVEIALQTYLATLPEKVRGYVLAHRNDYLYDYGDNAQRVERARLQGIEDGTWWANYRQWGGFGFPTKQREATPSTPNPWPKNPWK